MAKKRKPLTEQTVTEPDSMEMLGRLIVEAKDRNLSPDELLEILEDEAQDPLQWITRGAKRLGVETIDLIKSLTQTKFGAAFLMFAFSYAAEQYTKPWKGPNCVSVVGRNMSFALMVNEALPDGFVGDIVTSLGGIGAIIDSAATCWSGSGLFSEFGEEKKKAETKYSVPTKVIMTNAIEDALIEAEYNPVVEKKLRSDAEFIIQGLYAAVEERLDATGSSSVVGPLFEINVDRSKLYEEADYVLRHGFAMRYTSGYIEFIKAISPGADNFYDGWTNLMRAKAQDLLVTAWSRERIRTTFELWQNMPVSDLPIGIPFTDYNTTEAYTAYSTTYDALVDQINKDTTAWVGESAQWYADLLNVELYLNGG